MNAPPKTPRDSQPCFGHPDRRDVLRMGAAVAAAAAAGTRSASAQTTATTTFGSPVVELCVPAGVLTLEQKSAMVKGLTDVVLGALKLKPDPARRMFVAILETGEGGFGVDGQVFVPRRK